MLPVGREEDNSRMSAAILALDAADPPHWMSSLARA